MYQSREQLLFVNNKLLNYYKFHHLLRYYHKTLNELIAFEKYPLAKLAQLPRCPLMKLSKFETPRCPTRCSLDGGFNQNTTNYVCSPYERLQTLRDAWTGERVAPPIRLRGWLRASRRGWLT